MFPKIRISSCPYRSQLFPATVRDLVSSETITLEKWTVPQIWVYERNQEKDDLPQTSIDLYIWGGGSDLRAALKKHKGHFHPPMATSKKKPNQTKTTLASQEPHVNGKMPSASDL